MSLNIIKICFFVVLFFFVSLHSYAEISVCQIADGALTRASEIRGLKIRKKVPCLVHDKKEVEGYLRHTISTKMPPDRLRYEGLTYHLLGMIPESFSYESGIVDLYLSQLGGYYDPERKRFVMAGWLPAMFQTTIAVHELTHALQDQYFNLSTFIDMENGTTDMLTARSALVEGDATAVMTDYARELSMQPRIDKEENVESLMASNLLGASLTASLSSVPKSLQMMLLFPYTSGLRFVHYILKKGGYKKVDEVFRKPPRSTEEILHPEKYEEAKEDFKVFTDEELIQSANNYSGAILYKDSLGEFGISSLLSMYSSDARGISKAAAGWGGDRVILLGEKDKKSYLLIWRTHWDTEGDAEEFYKLFDEGFSKRFKDSSSDSNGFRQVSNESRGKLEKMNSDVILTIAIN